MQFTCAACVNWWSKQHTTRHSFTFVLFNKWLLTSVLSIIFFVCCDTTKTVKHHCLLLQTSWHEKAYTNICKFKIVIFYRIFPDAEIVRDELNAADVRFKSHSCLHIIWYLLTSKHILESFSMTLTPNGISFRFKSQETLLVLRLNWFTASILDFQSIFLGCTKR